MVYRLQEALYSLKQAPPAWNQRINVSFLQQGFPRSLANPNLYLFGKHWLITAVIFYVDDLIITSSHQLHISQTKVALSQEFEMIDLGPYTSSLVSRSSKLHKTSLFCKSGITLSYRKPLIQTGIPLLHLQWIPTRSSLILILVIRLRLPNTASWLVPSPCSSILGLISTFPFVFSVCSCRHPWSLTRKQLNEYGDTYTVLGHLVSSILLPLPTLSS